VVAPYVAPEPPPAPLCLPFATETVDVLAEPVAVVPLTFAVELADETLLEDEFGPAPEVERLPPAAETCVTVAVTVLVGCAIAATGASKASEATTAAKNWSFMKRSLSVETGCRPRESNPQTIIGTNCLTRIFSEPEIEGFLDGWRCGHILA
jgi:hypothetical protein